MATSVPDPDAMDIDPSEPDLELNRPAELVTVSGEIVEVDLDDLVNEQGDNVGLSVLKNDQEGFNSRSWMIVASELLRQGRVEMAQQTLQEGLGAFNARNDTNGMVEAYTLLGHISLLQSKSAPKVILRDAKYDKRTETRTKQDHWRAAHEHFSRAEQYAGRADAGKDRAVRRLPILIGRILLNLASFNFDEAERGIAQALRLQPNNLIVLMCQGRLGNAQRNPAIALKSYQKILALDPEFSPDPRVGLGLAFWQSGDIKKAKLAWRRALERDPACYGAKLLLATADGNDARDYNLALSSDKRQDLAVAALGTLNQLFKASKGMSAPAALSMVRPTEVKGQISQAIKLVERAIQFSDTMGHSRRAVSERTRLAYVEGDLQDVMAYAERAKTDMVPDVTVSIIRAQVAIKQGAQREALAIMEETSKKIGPTAPVEVAWLHALLLAYPYPGLSSEQRAAWTRDARDILDRLHGQVKAARAAGPAALARLRGLGEDSDTFVLLARLWQSENIEKAIGAYQTAISLHAVQLAGSEQPENARDIKGWRLSNNLATLYHLQGNIDSAMQLYEEIVAAIAEPKDQQEEILQSTLLYNLGRAYEDSKDYPRATEAYQGLLSRHPEYINAKIRLSDIAYSAGRLLEADALLKEANVSHSSDPYLRAYVSSHLYRQGMWDDLSKFAQASRKITEDKDAHVWCVLGAYHYHQARESRKGDHADRLKEFCRSAEAYNQALAADPACAVAAQGLAIAIAEDSMATKPSEALGGEESSKGARIRNAEAALAVFSRVKDSLLNVSVQVNSGHCYYVKGDEERAIEAYGSASLQAGHQDAQILLYLARAHYQLANKKSNFSAMIKGLSFSQRALRLRPADRTILYNIAMIEQKAAELLFSLPPAERTLAELDRATSLAEHSIVIFRALADVTERPLPYDPDLTDQRSRYGDSVLRRAVDQKQLQEEYESSQTAKDLAAKKRRAEERARIEEMEQARLREAQQRAAEEAEILRVQKEQARAWAQETRRAEEEEEQRRQEIQRARQERKAQEANWSGDEDGVERKPKPKRKSKKKQKQDEDEEIALDGDGLAVDEEEGELTGEEAAAVSRSRSRTPRAPKPKKKRPAAIDPDGDDEMLANRPAKKNKIKSVAVLGDTDSE